MTTESYVLKVAGMDEMLKKLERDSLLGEPVKRALTQSVLTIEGFAKEGTPVDTGRLRASITSTVDSSPVPAWGKVATNVLYANPVEFGTKPHFPPPAALEGWAHRHGMEAGAGYLIARAISKRGTKGKFMFKNALEKAKGRIEKYLSEASKAIEEIWSR